MQGRLRTWSGNCTTESRTKASAVENKVPSLYYTLNYSPAPFPLDLVLLWRWGIRTKNCSCAVRRRAALNRVFWGSGVQVDKHLPCRSTYLFTFLWRLGGIKRVSSSVSIHLCALKHSVLTLKMLSSLFFITEKKIYRRRLPRRQGNVL